LLSNTTRIRNEKDRKAPRDGAVYIIYASSEIHHQERKKLLEEASENFKTFIGLYIQYKAGIKDRMSTIITTIVHKQNKAVERDIYRVAGQYHIGEWPESDFILRIKNSLQCLRDTIEAEEIELQKLRKIKFTVKIEAVHVEDDKMERSNIAKTCKKFNQGGEIEAWNKYFGLKKKCNTLKFAKEAVGEKSNNQEEKEVKESYRQGIAKPIFYYYVISKTDTGAGERKKKSSVKDSEGKLAIWKKEKWKETGFKYKMKEEVIKIISNGDTDQKKCKRRSLNI
jgi:hypothetical protein